MLLLLFCSISRPNPYYFFFRIFIIISEPELKLVSVPQLFRFRYLHKKGPSKKKKKEYPAFEFYHHTCVKSIYTVPPDFLFIAYIPRLLLVFRLPPIGPLFLFFRVVINHGVISRFLSGLTSVVSIHVVIARICLVILCYFILVFQLEFC